MKKLIVLSICLLTFTKTNFAQENPTVTIPNPNDSRVITTAVPFVLIASDARAAGMGDMGVATSVDAYSQQWNPSKYAFSETKSGIGVSYTPYLSSLVNDIFLGNLSYYNRINDRSAFGVSFRYFSLGEIDLLERPEDVPLVVKPNEMTIDASYSLRLSDQYAMGVALRYLRSDLKIDQTTDASAGNSVAVDISGFYQSEEQAYNDFNGKWRGGFAIQNLGPKMKYDDGADDDGDFLPTMLRLGGGFDFIFDQYNKLKVTAEVAKLLVPTPPILGNEYEYNDVDNDGVYTEDVDELLGVVNENIIYSGQNNDVSFFKGIFQSFGDAPGGFSEELREFTWAVGAEYVYQDSFGLRLGYFNEADDKGARKFLALGAGFKFSTINVDLSYLFSTAKNFQSPLEGTIRFSLSFNFGEGTYLEY
jgi:hypothetical protein